MLAELELCRRELSFRKSQLAAAKEKLARESSEREEELSELRSDLRSFASSAAVLCDDGVEDDVVLQKELASMQQQLRRMSTRLLEARRVAERSGKVVKENAGRLKQEQRTRQKLKEHHELVEEVSHMRQELADASTRRDRLRHEAEKAEAKLKTCEETTADYETQAMDLREELRRVLLQLHVSHESAVEEQHRLQEHVAGLVAQHEGSEKVGARARRLSEPHWPTFRKQPSKQTERWESTSPPKPRSPQKLRREEQEFKLPSTFLHDWLPRPAEPRTETSPRHDWLPRSAGSTAEPRTEAAWTADGVESSNGPSPNATTPTHLFSSHPAPGALLLAEGAFGAPRSEEDDAMWAK